MAEQGTKYPCLFYAINNLSFPIIFSSEVYKNLSKKPSCKSAYTLGITLAIDYSIKSFLVYPNILVISLLTLVISPILFLLPEQFIMQVFEFSPYFYLI